MFKRLIINDEIHGMWLLDTLLESWEVLKMFCNSAFVILIDSENKNVLNEEAKRVSNASILHSMNLLLC